MNDSTPEWPPPPATPLLHSGAAPSRTFTDTATVDALLDASFAAYGYRICACGSCLEPPAAVCHACQTGNRQLGPLYGGSLAGPPATMVYAGRGDGLPYPLDDAPPCEGCATANERIDALLDQNDAQAIENSDLARQVVALKGHLEALSAQVRQGKRGAEGA